MTSIYKAGFGEVSEFMRRMDRAGLNLERMRMVNKDHSLASEMVRVFEDRLIRQQINPFRQTVEEQLAALREMNRFWKDSGHPHIGDIEATCKHLVDTASEWPEGRDAYRLIKVRFGEGRDGMIRTFEAHCAAVERVHGSKFWRWDLLLSGKHPHGGKDVDRLRLLNGNDTHSATVEWVIIPDLSLHRQRDSVTSVRGPQSLADEGLALAWLVPDRVRAIDYKDWPAWFCAGYETNVPKFGDESWQYVPFLDRYAGSGGVGMHACWHSDDGSGCSVPSARECRR